MKLADYVVQFLEKKKINTVFTVSGGGSIFLCDGLYKAKKLKYISCHHEQAVSFAAESYARSSNRTGCALVTTGPGGTNAVTGVTSSWIDSIPVIFISGQVFLNQTIGTTKKRQIGDQEINIVDLIKPITKYSVMVTKAEEIKFHLEKAYHMCHTGRPGPVWIDIPANIQNSFIDEKKLIGFKKNLKNNQQLIENLKNNFKKELHENFVPLKIKFDEINYSYRYKKR